MLEINSSKSIMFAWTTIYTLTVLAKTNKTKIEETRKKWSFHKYPILWFKVISFENSVLVTFVFLQGIINKSYKENFY